MKNIRSLFENFEGTWTLTREIVSGADILTAKGAATFTRKNASSLAYKEQGVSFSLGAQELPFFRHYAYYLQDNIIAVHYADGPQSGDLYQHYAATENGVLTPVAVHVCGDDRYDGSYAVFDDNHFHLTTRVKGPKKDYVMKTCFSRM